VVVDPVQWDQVTAQWATASDHFDVLAFGLGLVVFLLAVAAVGSWRR